ncbi:MAG: hypothetical protein CMJ83_17500 [Planctomycetes bacterium]|nr:hypothetical protein [Planctomycetota bacterium]
MTFKTSNAFRLPEHTGSRSGRAGVRLWPSRAVALVKMARRASVLTGTDDRCDPVPFRDPTDSESGVPTVTLQRQCPALTVEVTIRRWHRRPIEQSWCMAANALSVGRVMA